MLQLIQQYLDTFTAFFTKGTYDNSVDIAAASAFSLPDNRGFYLYVGVAGTVVGTTYGGQAVNRNFTAGYHCIKMKSITAATAATSVAACW